MRDKCRHSVKYRQTYIRLEQQRAVKEDGIVLGDGKVMHHNSTRNCDWNAALNNPLWVSHLVSHMRMQLQIVSKEEKLACKTTPALQSIQMLWQLRR